MLLIKVHIPYICTNLKRYNFYNYKHEHLTMAFDLDMIKAVYAGMNDKIAAARTAVETRPARRPARDSHPPATPRNATAELRVGAAQPAPTRDRKRYRCPPTSLNVASGRRRSFRPFLRTNRHHTQQPQRFPQLTYVARARTRRASSKGHRAFT